MYKKQISYCLLFLLLCICHSIETANDRDDETIELPYSIPLDHENLVKIKWYADKSVSKTIVFELSLITKYTSVIIGFGFSNYGSFENADFFLIEINKRNQTNFYDCHTTDTGLLVKDSTTNYRILNVNKQLGNEIVVRFEREFDTCDEKDYVIDSGTTHILHFIMDENYFKFDSLFTKKKFYPDRQADSKDMKRAQLLRVLSHNEYNINDDAYFEIRNRNVRIPSDDTTYWCLVYKLDRKFKKKHHITGFEGIIDKANEGVVHHMELFHCVTDPFKNVTTFSGVCTTEEKPYGLTQCRKVIAAWAMGADRFEYPDHVGGILGGDDFSLYLVLEIHYDNQKLRNDIIDSSGIRIYHTSPDNLRDFDAGIMEVGLEYNSKNSIPPQMNKFDLSGYCLSECTQIGLPNPTGITVFASQLHTHLTGRKVMTTILRRNKSVEILNVDNHYSPMFQEIRILEKPVQIMPGDVIINTCEFNTMSRHKMTLGGYAITDEMCVNYMHYYPIAKIEVCKSSIRDEVLQDFFTKLKEVDYANTSTDASNGENFNSIRWTPLTAKILDRLYNTATISFSCNSSDGMNMLSSSNARGKFKAIDINTIEFEDNKDECQK